MIGKAGAKILQMALEQLDEAVPVVRSAAEEIPDAARKALDDMAGAVGDWGWKGGKPGEITGGEFLKAWVPASESERRNLYRRVADQFRKSSNPLLRSIADDTDDWEYRIPGKMRDFVSLESAGIPRAYTGKVLLTLQKMNRSPEHFARARSRPRKTENFAQLISEALRPMTDSQRETYLALFPGHEGSFEQLEQIARIL